MHILTTCIITLFASSTCFATTWIVDPLNGDFTNIQNAIDASTSGDIISINAGTYYESGINTNGKAIFIFGATNADGSPAVTIDGQQNNTVIKMWSGESSTTVLENLIITGGQSAWGGGLVIYGSSPVITNCEFTGNTATQQGGAIYFDSATPTLGNCTISNNTATNGGGGMYSVLGVATIIDCTFDSNTSGSVGGGALFESADDVLLNCTFTSNIAGTMGGGLFSLGGGITLISCTSSGNSANVAGGGMYNSTTESSFLNESTVCGNSPDQLKGYWDIDNSEISTNCAESTGGCCVSSGCDVITETNCTNLGGSWLGDGITCDNCPTSCIEDINADGEVNIKDLLVLISAWGACP